eukprot:611210-Rhodomonas_salina.1
MPSRLLLRLSTCMPPHANACHNARDNARHKPLACSSEHPAPRRMFGAVALALRLCGGGRARLGLAA